MAIPGTKPAGPLDIREDPLKGMYVANSREVKVKSYERAVEMV